MIVPNARCDMYIVQIVRAGVVPAAQGDSP